MWDSQEFVPTCPEGEFLPILSMSLYLEGMVFFLFFAFCFHNMAPKHKAAIWCLTGHLVLHWRNMSIPVMQENLTVLGLPKNGLLCYKWQVNIFVQLKGFSSVIFDSS